MHSATKLRNPAHICVTDQRQSDMLPPKWSTDRWPIPELHIAGQEQFVSTSLIRIALMTMPGFSFPSCSSFLMWHIGLSLLCCKIRPRRNIKGNISIFLSKNLAESQGRLLRDGRTSNTIRLPDGHNSYFKGFFMAVSFGQCSKHVSTWSENIRLVRVRKMFENNQWSHT